jgi:molybdate transport system ATP-binding protein
VNRLSFQCRHTFAGGFSIEAAFEVASPIAALVGPSGAGKTTILYMLAGLLTPQAGVIRMNDHTWLDTGRGTRVKPEDRHVGFVFQDHLLFPHLTVERNLMYGRGRRRGRSSAIEPSRVIEVLELDKLLSRYPRNLSGGEQKRVALGRAILSGPELLLLDEPLTALDEPLKERILIYLERVIAEWHVPTIYVSHNIAEVNRLADHLVIFESGRVVCSGPAKDILQS